MASRGPRNKGGARAGATGAGVVAAPVPEPRIELCYPGDPPLVFRKLGKPRKAKPSADQRWVLMAGSMERSLEYMRDLYAALEVVESLHGKPDEGGVLKVEFSPTTFAAVKAGIANCAAELKRGLKARY